MRESTRGRGLGPFPGTQHIANLKATSWRLAVGGHHFLDNGIGADWSNVGVPAGGGSVTFTLTFLT